MRRSAAVLLCVLATVASEPRRDRCARAARRGRFVEVPCGRFQGDAALVASCDANRTFVWSSSAVERCGVARRDPFGAAEGRRGGGPPAALHAVGDSTARLWYAAALRVAGKRVGDLHGHRDFEEALPGGGTIAFSWAPFARNVTAWLAGRRAGEAEGVLVISVGLWHMLHVGDAALYRKDLEALREALLDGGWGVDDGRPAYWLGIADTVEAKLPTEQKRRMMASSNVRAYWAAARASGVLRPDGPLEPLGLRELAQLCGPGCTHDGIHYSTSVYDVAFQVYAHSRQRPRQRPSHRRGVEQHARDAVE